MLGVAFVAGTLMLGADGNLNSSVDHVLELVGALLGLAVVIALFGISNTGVGHAP